MKRVEPLHIANMLRAQGKHTSFHTPGHKRRGADITELSYSDCLLTPKGVIRAAEEDIARLLGASRSFLLTDGSTSGVFSMVYALKCAGVCRVACLEHSHRSVENACRILGIERISIRQDIEAGIPAQPAIEVIEAALDRADALLLTSPDYYGFFPPLKEAKALCAAKGKPLAIDGAHGAHLHFTEKHAGKYADLWVDGAHKSLPALTQGAVVSAKSESFAKWLEEGVKTFRTTSPSYPVMASVEYAIKYPRNGEIEAAAENAKRALGAVRNEDWSKIVVPFGEKCDDAQKYLEKKGVYPEFSDGNYLMFYLSPRTKKGELARLVRLLKGFPRGEIKGDLGKIPMYSEER